MQIKCSLCILYAYCEYVLLVYSGLTVNVENPTSFKEHAFYFLFMQDLKVTNGFLNLWTKYVQ
jgi:hypothetical protein